MSSLPHIIKGLTIATLAPILLSSVTAQSPPQAKSPVANIDYASFLGQHDMIWDQTPHRWEVSPYSGNGNIGFLFLPTQKLTPLTPSRCTSAATTTMTTACR